MADLQKAQDFFENFLGESAGSFVGLAKSGSARNNYIASACDKNFIVTTNNDVRENEAFFYLSGIFSELKLNTPEIYKISEDRMMYVQQFLGGKTLSDVISDEGLSERVKKLVKSTLKHLQQLQSETVGKINFEKAFEYESYNELPVMHDLYYFKNFLVDVLEISYHKSTLLQEFQKITKLITSIQPRGIMVRDFQARNIMVNDADEISFIDYQAAMEGPLMYDVVSFLYQAKANFPDEFRYEMITYYLSLWDDEKMVSELKNSLEPLKLIRFLQVLGAYGFRGIIQRKSHFMESLAQGIENIYGFTENWKEIEKFPELRKLILKLHEPSTFEKVKNLLHT